MKNGTVIRLDDHSAKLIELLGERARVAFEAIGTRAEKYAKQALTNSMNEGIDLTQHGEADNSRVDTGRLRNSVTHAIADNGTEKAVYIGTNVPYAPYHEFGTGIYATSGGGRRTASRQCFLARYRIIKCDY